MIEEFAADTRLLSTVQRVTLTGISIVSLRNEGFPMISLCLTMECHFGFTEKLQNSRSRQLFANSFRGNAASSFVYAAVSDISYIVKGIASWEKESCSVVKLWASNIRVGYCTLSQ